MYYVSFMRKIPQDTKHRFGCHNATKANASALNIYLTRLGALLFWLVARRDLTIEQIKGGYLR